MRNVFFLFFLTIKAKIFIKETYVKNMTQVIFITFQKKGNYLYVMKTHT